MPRLATCLLALLILPGVAPDRSFGADGSLETIREDVRGRKPAAAPSPPASGGQTSFGARAARDAPDWDDDGSFTRFALTMSYWAAASPLWLPILATGDDMQFDAPFQRFPYHVTPGRVVRPADLPDGLAGYATLAEGLDGRRQWLQTGRFPPRLRRWSARLSADYASELDDLQRVGGRLLVSTSSRFGLDTEMSHFEERLPDGRRDRLWLGDGNLVFRFAQSDRSEWRIGLGMNWLDDRERADYGFNFTYGVDLFPRRPWVISLDIDWGTLGRAGLFRGRATAGVVVWGLETYLGYEYLDIGRTRCNSLVAGVRVWW